MNAVHAVSKPRLLVLTSHCHHCPPAHNPRRTLAEEDIASTSAGGASSRPLTEAAGPECEQIYAPGRAESAGFGGPKSALYVVSKAGYFPDICEGLAYKHLSRGDKVGGGER